MLQHPHRGGSRDGAWDPGEAADLRRRHRREVVDRLLDGAAHLPDDERALLEAVYRDGRSAKELAALGRAPERAMRRRIKRLTVRVLDPRFHFVARRLGAWSPTRRRVAQACVLGGRSLREAADELALSLHTVRRHHDAVNALYEAEAPGGGRA